MQLQPYLGGRLIEPGEPTSIAGFTVTTAKQQHGGDSYGFRFERDGNHNRLVLPKVLVVT